MAVTFNDFIQNELPKRPFTSADGAAGQMLVRSHRPERPRELVWADVPTGGAGSGFDPSAFPAASSDVPEAFLVRQSGAWTVASFAQMQGWLQCCDPVAEPLPPCRVTVNGVGVIAGGVDVVVGECATDLPPCAVTVNGAGVVAGGVQVVVGDCGAVAVEINGEAVTVDGVAVTVNGGRNDD